MKDIGIVVLNYEKYQMTCSCVDVLCELGLDFQIVIVDNASKNESYDYLSERYNLTKNVKVIQNSENAGYARGNNFGIKYLIENYKDVKYFCIMNPDVKITYKDIFQNLKRKLEQSEDYAAATGLMITNGNLDLDKCFWNYPKKREIALGHSVLAKSKKNILRCVADGIAVVQALPGSFFMMKKDVFVQLNGLDEGTFLYNEENILAIQLEKIGKKNIISVNDYYEHNHPKGERKSLKAKLNSRKYGNQSRRYLCRKYYHKVDGVLLEGVIASNYFIITIKHLLGNIRRLFK